MEKGPLTDEYLIYGEGLDKPAEPKVPEAERLLKEFESHDGKEGDFIRSYKEIATKSKDSNHQRHDSSDGRLGESLRLARIGIR